MHIYVYTFTIIICGLLEAMVEQIHVHQRLELGVDHAFFFYM